MYFCLNRIELRDFLDVQSQSNTSTGKSHEYSQLRIASRLSPYQVPWEQSYRFPAFPFQIFELP
jgi:hypothetical protein